MKSKMIVLSLFIVNGFVGQAQVIKTINQESVSAIKKGNTTKNEIKSWFGEPTGSATSSLGDYWIYSMPTEASQLIVYFDTLNLVSNYSWSAGNLVPKKRSLQDRQDFIDLIKKVQKDKSINGTLLYKESQVTIIDDPAYKTAIGKFIKIDWKGYSGYFHTSLGYMTRNRFSITRKALRNQGKIEKDKYCLYGRCYELRDDEKLPYVIEYQQTQSEVRVIE